MAMLAYKPFAERLHFSSRRSLVSRFAVMMWMCCLRGPQRWSRSCVWLVFVVLCLAVLYLVCLQSWLLMLLHSGAPGPAPPSISTATAFQDIRPPTDGNKPGQLPSSGGTASQTFAPVPQPSWWGPFLSRTRSFWHQLLKVLSGSQRSGRVSSAGVPAQPLPWSVWQTALSSQVLGPRLQQVFQNYRAMNKYRVPPGAGQPQGRSQPAGAELLCQLKHRVAVSTLLGDDGPFVAPAWREVLPRRNLAEDIGPLERCAVVSSAGSMLGSGLGKEIGECLRRERGVPPGLDWE